MIDRILRRARKQPSVDRRQRDSGFTLIELLVVLVILPLIIGAVAEAIIVSFQNEPSTSNRLSDTTNAQLTTQYFVRDVQGATEVTTDQQLFLAASYGPYSPQVCGTSNSDKLLVALYRPALGGASALDVAYWQHTTALNTFEIIRYSCFVQGDYSSASPVSEVLASPPPGNLAGNANPSQLITANVSISPDQFIVPASNGWASAVAQTVVSAQIGALSGAPSISVASVSGFATGPLWPITISTSLGAETVTCTGTSSAPAFTGCTSSGTGAASVGALVTQSDISSVQLNVNEPASSYNFNVLGSPRGGSASSASTSSGGPTLLALGSSGITQKGTGTSPCNNNAKICVHGDIVIDGTVACNGNAQIWASVSIGSSATPTPSCNGAEISNTPPIADPVAASLPSCFAPSVQLQTNPPPNSNNYLVPGIYTTPISGTLEPGVYVAEGGVSGDFTTALSSPGDPYFYTENPSHTHTYDSHAGVLIYLPGVGPYASGCLTVSTAAVGQASLEYKDNNATVSVVPLDALQSAFYFYGNTALGDMWVWQDQTNTNPVLYSNSSTFCSGNIDDNNFYNECNSQVASPTVLYGLLYAPSGVVELGSNTNLVSGRMIVGGVAPTSGTPGITLTGQ
jgi:prepilin-type N-terminal cleavage/methylation domain-containing protein